MKIKFVPVKTGDTINIGTNDLIFVEARIHWPDSMFTYMTNITFCLVTMHRSALCSEYMYNDRWIQTNSIAKQ